MKSVPIIHMSQHHDFYYQILIIRFCHKLTKKNIHIQHQNFINILLSIYITLQPYVRQSTTHLYYKKKCKKKIIIFICF